MLWVLLSLLASSALVVQLRLLMATAVVLYRTTVYVIIMCVNCETVFHNIYTLRGHTHGDICRAATDIHRHFAVNQAEL